MWTNSPLMRFASVFSTTVVLCASFSFCLGQHLIPDYRIKVAGSAFHRLAVDAQANTFIYGVFDDLNGENRGRLLKLDATGNFISSFQPVIADGDILDLAFQADGKIVICGNFARINNVNVGSVARLNADGSVDNTFTCALTGVVKVKLQNTGKAIVLVDGAFERLNTDGSIDGTFGFTNFVYSNAPYDIAPDNSIYFSNYYTVFKLTSNGVDDHSFQIGAGAAGGQVHVVKVQADGKVLVGGTFTKYNDVSSKSLARLKTTGQVDETFVVGAGADGGIATIIQRPNNNVLIAGTFTNYNGVSAGLVELNMDGSFFKAIATVSINQIHSIASGPDNKITIGGEFSVVNGITVFGVSRFNTNYTMDMTFMPQISYNNSNSRLLAVGPNLQSLVTGHYEMHGVFDGNSLVRGRAFRFNPAGVREPSFNPFVNGELIYSSYIQEDGKMILNGWLGDATWKLKRLNVNGTTDPSFNVGSGPTLNGTAAVVYLIKKIGNLIYVGGRFSHFNGVESHGFIAIDESGKVRQAFPQLLEGSSVAHVVRQSNGKLILMGDFPRIGPLKGIIRLNADGAIDPTFYKINVYNPADFAVDSEDNIYVVGSALYPEGSLLKHVIKLTPNGAVDGTFDIGSGFSPDGYVVSVVVLPGDRIAVGGYFDSVQGVEQPGFAVLNTDGELLPLPAPFFGKRSAVIKIDDVQGQLFLTGKFRTPDYTEAYGVARVEVTPLTVPTAPANLQVTLHTPGKFLITWEDKSMNEGSFVLERAVGNTSAFIPYDTLAANSIDRIDEIVPEQNYSYRVRAFNSLGYSMYSNVASLTWNPMPEGVIVLSAFDPTTPQAFLEWTSTAMYHNAYIIERAEGDAGQFVARDTIHHQSTTYHDPVDLHHMYRYRVRAYNSSGSIVSNTKMIFWYPLPEGSVNLSIPAPANTSLALQISGAVKYHDGYIVGRMIGLQDDFINLDTLPKNATSYFDTIEPETEYRYRVQAYNRNGELTSDTLKVIWIPVPTGSLSLSIPNPESTTVSLVIAGSVVNHTGYVVERSANSGYVALDTLPANAEGFVDEIERDKQYEYRIQAFNHNGILLSNVVSVSWRPVPQGTLTLNIPAPTDNYALLQFTGTILYHTGYIVERSVNNSPYVARDTIAVNATNFHDEIAPHADIRYRVKAFNDNGSISSGIVAASWRPVPSGGIEASIFVPVPGEAELTWLHTVTHHSGFAIQRAETPDGEYQAIDSVNASTTSYTDITNGHHQYHYRIAAFNPAGVVFSNTISMLVTGAEYFSVGDLAVWPNPAGKDVFVEKKGVSDPAGIWRLIQSNGMVHEVKAISAGEVLRFDVSHLPNGIFVLQFISGKEKRSRKIAKN